MKIFEILKNFNPDDDISPKDAIEIFRHVIQSGKDKPALSDYNACPICGSTSLYLVERVRNLVKGTILCCKDCQWELIGDDWDWLNENERTKLINKYRCPME